VGCYSGKRVTVDLYRDLPTDAYGILILRVCSSATEPQKTGFAQVPVCLFTSENYVENDHAQEQLNDQLAIASYTVPQLYYFAIKPAFVKSHMDGRFRTLQS
jgi:hypothetical protein